ncbi:hypothetical protein MMC25_002010 [Agyrium rufum]|nr:hypothetical protein [Agyrium rufum]
MSWNAVPTGPLEVPHHFDPNNRTQAVAFLGKLTSGKYIHGPEDVDFWYGIVIVIGVAMFINIYFLFQTWAKLRAADARKSNPSRPANVITKTIASITSLIRNVANRQWAPKTLGALSPPPLGTCLLLLVYFGYVGGMEYYHAFVSGAQHWEDVGLRSGWLALSQVPLLILLAGKNNLIGLFTGISYERLNVFHRWVGRVIWFSASLHWAYQQYGWSLLGLTDLEQEISFQFKTGVAAWAFLTWLFISSLSPIRNWKYEFFLAQHIICWMAFIILVLYHMPYAKAKLWVYIPMAFWLFDRLIGAVRFSFNNSKVGRATTVALPGGVTKIHVKNSRLTRWSAGQHAFISLPQFGMVQAHPATILSTPKSHGGDVVFIMKAHKGFTSRVLQSASTSELPLLEKSHQSRALEAAVPTSQQYTALLSGPYGSSHLDFAAFDSVMLIAGSTGITFNLPLLLNMAERSQKRILPVRTIQFIWIVKSSTWTSWVSEELRSAVTSLQKAGINITVKIFVTKDDGMTDTSITVSPTAAAITGPTSTTTTTKHGVPEILSSASDQATRSCTCLDLEKCACITTVDPISPSPSSPALASMAEKFAITTTVLSSSTPSPHSPSSTPSSPLSSPSSPTESQSHIDVFATTTGSTAVTAAIEGHAAVSYLPSSTPLHIKGVDFATLHAGRPALEDLIGEFTAGRDVADVAIGVCGPLALNARVRGAVTHRAGGVYLHVEGFGW